MTQTMQAIAMHIHFEERATQSRKFPWVVQEANWPYWKVFCDVMICCVHYGLLGLEVGSLTF